MPEPRSEPVEDPREWPTSPVASPVRKRRKKGKKPGTETAIWDGFVKAPTQLETTIQESLLYPLWSAQGVVLLVLFPPILWLISGFLFALVAGMMNGPQRFLLPIAIASDPDRRGTLGCAWLRAALSRPRARFDRQSARSIRRDGRNSSSRASFSAWDDGFGPGLSEASSAEFRRSFTGSGAGISTCSTRSSSPNCSPSAQSTPHGTPGRDLA